MKKKLPKFNTIEKEAEFWKQHDSADYIDWNKAKKARFPMAKPFSNLEKKMSPASRKRVTNKAKKLLQEMALGELRHAKELSQEELSKRLRVEQSQDDRA